MDKSNLARMMAEATQAGRVYRPKGGFKGFCWFMAIVCTILVVTIPFAILMYLIAIKACIAIADDGVVVKWMGTRVIAWDEFEAFKQGTLDVVGVGGLAGAAIAGAAAAAVRGPLQYKLKTRKTWGNMAVHWHEGSMEIISEFETRTGIEIIPKPEAADPAVEVVSTEEG